MKKAEQDRREREGTRPTFTQGRAVMTDAGPRRVSDAIDPPIAFQPNPWTPTSAPLNGHLEPVSKDDYHQFQAGRRGVPLDQRVAQLKGGK